MFINKIKNEIFLARNIVQLNQMTLPPNQSLNLTEPAVDDLARAKAKFIIGRSLPRADWLPSQRIFRRRLAPVRYASLAAGEAWQQRKLNERSNVSNSHGAVLFSTVKSQFPPPASLSGGRFEVKD